MRLYSNLDILSFGTQISKGRFFLGFSVRERLSQHITIPENLYNLLWYGNAAPQLFGRYANIAPSINVTAFDEWGASFSGYAMKRKMTWGGRLKYLSGRINVLGRNRDPEIQRGNIFHAIDHVRGVLEYPVYKPLERIAEKGREIRF